MGDRVSDQAYQRALEAWVNGGKKPPRPTKRPDGIPTRYDALWMTDAELAITAAMMKVENSGDGRAITDAVLFLSLARECVADFVEQVASPWRVEFHTMPSPELARPAGPAMEVPIGTA